MTPADAPRFTWCARVLAPSDPARLAPPPPPPAENPRASRSPHPSRPVPDPLSLFQAAQRGDPSVIRVLVTDCGIPVDVKDKDGVTPLMSAADYAKDAAVRELLKLGAKHDAKKSDGVMAVHRAASSALSDGPPTDTCSKNAANAVRLLVEASEGGADAGTLDAPSDAGTPFLCACARGAEATIRCLAAKGANAAATLRNGVGAAALASASGLPGALRAALEAGAPTSLRPPGGMTALHVAASHPSTAGESTALVRALLDAGADADATDGEGLKAVHAAAAVGRIPVVEMLLKVTSPDDGVAAGDWTATNVQKITQAKLRAVGGGEGGTPIGGTPIDAAANEAPYEAKGVTDANAAATTKRAGDEAFIRGDNDAAVSSYDASLAADDTNAKVWANRAAAKLKLKNHVGARRDAKIARELDATYVKAWYREGCALTEMGEYESAALAFFEGMQIDGDNKDLKRGFDAAIARGREAHLKETGKK